MTTRALTPRYWCAIDILLRLKLVGFWAQTADSGDTGLTSPRHTVRRPLAIFQYIFISKDGMMPGTGRKSRVERPSPYEAIRLPLNPMECGYLRSTVKTGTSRRCLLVTAFHQRTGTQDTSKRCWLSDSPSITGSRAARTSRWRKTKARACSRAVSALVEVGCRKAKISKKSFR